MKIKAVKSENAYLLIILCAAALSIFLYTYLPTSALFIFNSPDETANFFATESFNFYNSFGRPEPLNDIAGGLIHPRSIVARGDYLLPVSFIGLPLIYGALSKVTGLGLVPFFVPFFSSAIVVTAAQQENTAATSVVINLWVMADLLMFAKNKKGPDYSSGPFIEITSSF